MARPRYPRNNGGRRGARRHRRRRFFNGAELRLVLVIGVTLGLVSQLGWIAPGNGAAIPAAAPRFFAGGGPVRVIDGDTFDHRGMRIRIADIDTPELEGQCPDERRRARQAKERLRSLLAAGPFGLESVERDEDRYGRKLRVVVRDGRSLGDVLVAEGLARTWSGRREPWC